MVYRFRYLSLWLVSICLAVVSATAQTDEGLAAQSQLLRWAITQTGEPILGDLADSARVLDRGRPRRPRRRGNRAA